MPDLTVFEYPIRHGNADRERRVVCLPDLEREWDEARMVRALSLSFAAFLSTLDTRATVPDVYSCFRGGPRHRRLGGDPVKAEIQRYSTSFQKD